jgi:hypothetical protein
MKLSVKENFNGCHSRQKAAVLWLLYVRAVLNDSRQGLPQAMIAKITGVKITTINSEISMWHKHRLITRKFEGVIRNNRPVYCYSLGSEAREWIEDVYSRRKDVIIDAQRQIDLQLAKFPLLAIGCTFPKFDAAGGLEPPQTRELLDESNSITDLLKRF